MNHQLRKTAGFGAKLATYELPRKPADNPAWANPGQRDDWRSRGLVLWQDDARQITLLSAQDALDVLADMRASSAWKQAGRMVGRPALQWFSLSDAQCAPEWVLADTISLTSAQAQELFRLLQTGEPVLRTVAETVARVLQIARRT